MNFVKFKTLVKRYPSLAAIEQNILSAYTILKNCYANDHTVYLCGNGGSASDCEHIMGELMKPFQHTRSLSQKEKDRLCSVGDMGYELSEKLQKGLPAISLVSHHALNTAISNDMGWQYIYAQQIFNYGKAGDILICISTSGNSENVLYAAAAARAKDVQVIALTGRNGGQLKALSDVCICCPADTTEEIQEYHLPIYHTLCAALESHFWGTES